jgi:hypothetical protein
LNRGLAEFTLGAEVNGSDQSIVAILLIMLLITSVIVGAFLVGLADHLRRRRLANGFSCTSSCDASSELFIPFLFDRPTKWLAIRCSDILKIQAVLGLHNPTPCSWSDGFSRSSDRKLFITPPVQGWSLVVGQGLPEPGDDIDQLYHFLTQLGRALGSVQYFHAERVFNHHAWVRIENNQIYRAYAWAGETLWNQGEATAAEKALELKCYAYGENPIPFPFSPRDSHGSNTEKVIQLAARWSVDPMAINSLKLKAGLGITGEISNFRMH